VVRRVGGALAVASVIALMPSAARATTPPSLQTQVARALALSTAPLVGAAVAIEGGPRVDIAGSRPLPPASTQKLYTAATALVDLGPDHRLRTEVRATGPVLPDGTLEGDLVLVGGGDPTLTGNGLQEMAFTIAGAGVTHVTGALYADDSRYDRAHAASGWKAAYVPGESGPLSAVVVDRNLWRRDAAYLSEPVAPDAGRLRTALRVAGITVDGPDTAGPSPSGPGDLLAWHDSPPVVALVSSALKHSDNFIAEQLDKELGATIGIPTTMGGVEAAWRLAESFGLARGQSADGSGLSLHDRESPWYEVRWLQAIGATSVADMFRTSLPLACGDGTLKQRMCATSAAGRVFAKTGSLPGISTLAGYATTVSGRRVWFAFMVAGARSDALAHAAIDRATVAVTSYAG